MNTGFEPKRVMCRRRNSRSNVIMRGSKVKVFRSVCLHEICNCVWGGSFFNEIEGET